jgi:hypothetical protein
MPPDKLEELLQPTFKLITVRDLRSIPAAIIKTLPRVPETYLKALAHAKLRPIFQVFCLFVSYPFLELKIANDRSFQLALRRKCGKSTHRSFWRKWNPCCSHSWPARQPKRGEDLPPPLDLL